MKVLVVDDNECNRYQLQVVLSANGYSVVTAANGVEALEEARRVPPDLVITDILMPVMDGYSLCRAWKQDDGLRDIPLVFYTATYTDERDREFALSLGARDFILKPEEPDVFVLRVGEAIRQTAREAPALAPPAAPPPEPSPVEALDEEASYLRQYNEVLVHKLEAKVAQLEGARGALERDAAVRERLLAAIERLPEAIVICDAQGAITYANRASRELHGAGGDGAVGRALDAFCGEGFGPEVEEAVRTVMRTRNAWRGRHPDVTAGGDRRLFDIAVAPTIGEDGEVTGFSKSAHDVTEIEALEAQLHQAQKMEALGALAGGVAHDFNNLLMVVMGQADLLRGTIDERGDAPERVDAIIGAGERAARLVRQLLAFSRRQDLVEKRVNLGELLPSLVSMLRRLVREDIEFSAVIEPGLWSVMADPTQIEQVVVNLVVNARDAIPRAGRITLRASNVGPATPSPDRGPGMAPGPSVMLAVEDTGTGMTSDQQARIFEPFFSTKGDGGTGLGLSTVYGIVKQSGGEIRVSSQPGVGTTMRVYLPRADDADAPVTDRPAVVAGAATRSPATVLVVEDDPQVRAFVGSALQASGYTVLLAADAGEALLIADGGARVDLVLTDVVMPGMRGPELADLLKTRLPGASFLCMSGYHDHSSHPAGPLEAASELLLKPFHASDLLSAVERALAGGHLAEG